jgi:hypothetical protein
MDTSGTPRQSFKTEGEAIDREDAMKQFKAVWEVFASDQARLEKFLAPLQRRQ